jgi:ribosome-binding protein aMBF1 (putative translation factor)
MSDKDKFQPRQEWPDFITQPLEHVGIGRYETVETIKPKIESLGLQVVALNEDWGGVASTYPLYYAAVIDPNDEDSVRGEYWSSTDYAEALAWATATALNDREERQQRREERLASTDPDGYILREFGETVREAKERLGILPDDAPKQEFVAQIVVGEEVVSRVEMPFIRGGKQWDRNDEQSLELRLAEWAMKSDLKQRVGPIRLVVDPATDQQREYPVNRGGSDP